MRHGAPQTGAGSARAASPWGLQIAKADLRTVRGLDEFADHLLTKHDGNMNGVKEMFANAKVTLTDD